jgi:hypothetical protein
MNVNSPGCQSLAYEVDCLADPERLRQARPAGRVGLEDAGMATHQNHPDPEGFDEVGQGSPLFAGHHGIDEDEIEGGGRENSPRFCGIGRGRNGESLIRERLAQKFTELGNVIDD